MVELQQTVERISEENKELKAVNETMRFQLQTVFMENQQLRMICGQALPQGMSLFPQMQQQQSTATTAGTMPTGVNGFNQSLVAGMPPAHTGAAPTGTQGIPPPAGSMPTGAVNQSMTMPGTMPTGVSPFVGNMPMYGVGNMLPLSVMHGMMSGPGMVSGTMPAAASMAPSGIGGAPLPAAPAVAPSNMMGGGTGTAPSPAIHLASAQATGRGTQETQVNPAKPQGPAPAQG